MTTRYADINDRHYTGPYGTSKPMRMPARRPDPDVTPSDRVVLRQLANGPKRAKSSTLRRLERVEARGLVRYHERSETWALTARGEGLVREMEAKGS